MVYLSISIVTSFIRLTVTKKGKTNNLIYIRIKLSIKESLLTLLKCYNYIETFRTPLTK